MNATATALTIVDQVEQSPAVLALDARAQALVDLLPDQAAADRFRRVVIQALVKNPELLECTPDSVVLSVFEAAAQGLEPTGAAGGAHLVPYNVNVGSKDRPRYEKRAQLIVDYRGVIRLVTKPDSEIASMEARVVKEGDEFSYQLGTDAFVNHVPSLDPGRSAKATTHVYSIARLRRGGAPLVDVEDRAGVERVQKRGRQGGFSPWSSDWDEMAKKTIIKRHAKVLPVRPEIRSLLVREDELGGIVDDAPAAAVPAGETRAAQLGSRIRQPRNVTPAEVPPATEPETAAQPFGSPESDAPTLIDRLRANAEASSLVGAMTEPQQAALNTLFAGVDYTSAIAPVLGTAFELAAGDKPNAAQAQAIVSLAASIGPQPFLQLWQEAAS
jgi:recombination protein RecT